MFLSGITFDKNMLIFLLSIAFVLVIIIIWIIVSKISKSVKTDKYYKQLAKEELASLGCDEFAKKDEKKENSDDKKDAPVDDNKEVAVCALPTEEIIEEKHDDENPESAEDNEIEPISEPELEPEAAEEVVDDTLDVEAEPLVEPVALEATEEATEDSTSEVVTEANLDSEDDHYEEATEEIKEEPEVSEKPKKKGRTYNGKYEIYQTADGYAYNLKASNGEILVSSETYTTRDGVLKAINAVKRNLENGEVRIFADKRGQYKFKLVSRNYRILAISSNYSVEKSAIRASESFKKFALKADIVDVELVDADIKTATLIEIGEVEDKKDGRFVVEKFNGEYSWDLKASNGQILCQAEGYTSKAGCMYSIETFKRNVETGTFKTVKDKMGNFLFKLYNTSGRICAVGESYSTKQRAEDAARSVVSFYQNAQVVEVKETKTKK